MSRELLASQKNNSGILLDPRTKLAVLITIAVFILGGSYEGIMQYYIIVLAAIPLLLLLAARKWKGAVLYILIFGGSLCLEMFGLSRLTGVANYIAVAIVGILLRFTPSVVMGYFVVTTTTVSEFVAAMERLHLPQQPGKIHGGEVVTFENGRSHACLRAFSDIIQRIFRTCAHIRFKVDMQVADAFLQLPDGIGIAHDGSMFFRVPGHDVFSLMAGCIMQRMLRKWPCSLRP